MVHVVLAIHILIGLLLILIVLLQSGRSGGFSNLMGGGGGDALFSTSGQQSGLRKVTIVLAGMFMATSLWLTLLSSSQANKSVALQNFSNLPPVDAPTSSLPSELPSKNDNPITNQESAKNLDSSKDNK